MTEDAPRFQWWVSAEKAKAWGCTHHARCMGIVPGFFGVESGVWVARSDLLNPIEDLLTWAWVQLRILRGEEPDFMFKLGREVA